MRSHSHFNGGYSMKPKPDHPWGWNAKRWNLQGEIKRVEERREKQRKWENNERVGFEGFLQG